MPFLAVAVCGALGGFGSGAIASLLMSLETEAIFFNDRISLIDLAHPGRLLLLFLFFLMISGLLSYFRSAWLEAEKTRERFRFLTEAVTLLNSSPDYNDALKSLSHLLVPTFADGCAIDILGTDQVLRRLCVTHSDPNWEKVAQQAFLKCFNESCSKSSVTEVIQGRIPDFIFNFLDKTSRLAPSLEKSLSCLRAIGVNSLMVVPLSVRNQTFGAISFFCTLPNRNFDRSTLSFAKKVARHAALPIHNAILLNEARTAVKFRDDLLAVVSHDLKNPVTSIRLNTELLAKLPLRPESEPRLRRISDHIHHSTQRMIRLISDMLDFGKIMGGHLKVERKSAEVAPILSETVEMLRPLATQKEIHLETRLEDIEKIRCACDHERISQALSNILGNAIKFTPKNGRIVVQAQSEEDHLLVSVLDTGPGISEKNLYRIFDRYWQESPAQHEGVGLGLSITKGIVEAHGGSIWAERLPEGGTALHFTLPFVSYAQVS